ncbi:hypothetical protein K1719_033349 [Acacia pycnantha]|nr:hypothetical protein K1719_033349 [Acacia pycnantha]
MASRRCSWGLSCIKKNLCATFEEGAEKPAVDSIEYNDTWIQCDACQKWRKLADSSMANTNVAWFCCMNTDPLYQSCSIPEQSWHNSQ